MSKTIVLPIFRAQLKPTPSRNTFVPAPLEALHSSSELLLATPPWTIVIHLALCVILFMDTWLTPQLECPSYKL